MTTYTVTTELKTSWWVKLLRYFRLKNKRKEFKVTLGFDGYWYGDIIGGHLILDIKHWTNEDFIDSRIKELDNGSKHWI